MATHVSPSGHVKMQILIRQAWRGARARVFKKLLGDAEVPDGTGAARQCFSNMGPCGTLGAPPQS